MRHFSVIVAAIVAALCLAAPPAAHAANYEIVIKNMQFGTAPNHLKIGDTITWRNADFLRHTATARNGAFDVKLDPGAKVAVTLQKAGPLLVFCRYHPNMTLALSVAK